VVEREWADLIDGSELPAIVDPADGILASANNAPHEPAVTISHFFSTDHRVDRWRELLDTLSAGTIADLAAFQLDVFYRPAAEMRDRLLALFADIPDELPAGRPSWIALAGWDGRYAEDSPGALAF
jgi:penicillin amidase